MCVPAEERTLSGVTTGQCKKVSALVDGCLHACLALPKGLENWDFNEGKASQLSNSIEFLFRIGVSFMPPDLP